MTYFMNTTTLMQQLITKIKKLNISIELKEIHSFNEIPEEIVFNCSGMGARELNSDQNMIPVLGHLVILNEAAGNEHMDYSLYMKIEQDGKEEFIYMIPKNLSVTSENPNGLPCYGALGGTFIPHTDRLSLAEQEWLNQVEFKRMLDRNSEFFHGYPFKK